ncbi:hypothetical protein OESDEN_00218 [Oesophagostomum dentatum]|uniref:Chondroitin proteoglycan 4 domain-containing protein n=1 Tax=Oesophagostomum dentatum TaxID=61180 RepID=A0A0B1TVB5_OESDE|nr:hypothetical protein OESDEN_00218 [Oesophagostomum dentatum]
MVLLFEAKGFPEFTNNDQCASTVFLTGISDMRTCDNNFASSLQRDTNPMNTCAYVEVAKECYMTAFTRRCGQYPEVVWWGCNYERIMRKNDLDDSTVPTHGGSYSKLSI